jgi:hypothetical protein
MRRLGMTTGRDLVVALAGKCALGSRADRGPTLDKFVSLTGHPAQRLPFVLLEFDIDQDSVFANERWGLLHGSRDGIHPLPAISQERPDVGGAEEQRLGPSYVGYRRYEGSEAAALDDLS